MDNALQQEKPRILIVDDTQDNLDILTSLLDPLYQVQTASNGFQAINLARAEPHPDLVLLDVMMPEMDGYTTCQQLKNDPLTSHIPVIFITAHEEHGSEAKGFELGAVDYLTKPVSAPILWARIRTHLTLSNQTRQLESKVAQRTHELQVTRLKIVQRLGRAAEFRDNETGFHVIRMSHYSRLIAKAYGGNEEWVERLYTAAPMHDIGKIGVPDAVLLKPGKLDADEWELMKKHTLFGADIIGEDEDPLLVTSRVIALSHHEKWDGSGYPQGLSNEQIPIEGRIVAIADVFDALLSERPYKKPWPVEKAIGLIRENAGKHFDPHLVECFDRVLPDIERVRAQYMDEPCD